MPYFFVYPFGVSGDRSDIPDSTQPTGTVSYQSGFTEKYQRVLGVDPLAIPVPRNQSNQLYYDITDNIKQYQTQGVPNWITATDNLGSSYAYELNAICRYDAGSGAQIWESTVGGNTSTPGDDTNWRLISGNSQGVPVGTIIDFGGISVPELYLPCDNSLLIRADYPLLFNALTSTQEVTLTFGSPEFTVSSAFGLYGANGAALGMQIESTGFPADTRVLSVDGTTITATKNAESAGAVNVTFFQWGAGNGTTKFNAPDFRRRVSVGQGGSSTTTLGNCVGQSGGAETVTLTTNNIPPHNHPGSLAKNTSPNGVASFLTGNGTVGAPRFYLVAAGHQGSSAYNLNINVSANPASPYSQEGANVIQPSKTVYKLIKYA